MWLPERAAFDFPVLPAVGKHEIAALAALLWAATHVRRRVRAARIGRGFDFLILLLVPAVYGTVLTNRDLVVQGAVRLARLPGLTMTDPVSMSLDDLIHYGVPWWLGRTFLRTSKDLRDFFHALVACGLVYTVPILWEKRMSPNLHSQLWGFASRQNWMQNTRGDAYRPTVFMEHPLTVGMFMFITTVAAVALYKAGRRAFWDLQLTWIIAYLFLVLFLCKASAALIYAVVVGAFIVFLSPKWQVRWALILGLAVVAYPITRVYDVFPTQKLVALSNAISKDRGSSLLFRFDNEDVLVARAMERPWFGWGGFGRERLFDNEMGKDVVVQDGEWVIGLGQRGAVGLFLRYLILLLPLFIVGRRLKHVPRRSDRVLVTAATLILAVCAVNTLPNMTLQNIPYYISGGLLALLRELPMEAQRAKELFAQGAQSGPSEPQPEAAAARVDIGPVT
jgi:hypothetical protein